MLEYSEDQTLKSIDTDSARGAVTGHNVRYVLAAGLMLVILCFLVLPALI